MLTGIKRFLFGDVAKQLSPQELNKKLKSAMEEKRIQMPNGSYNVPNHYTVSLSEMDFDQLRPLLNDTRLQLEQYLKSERDKRKYGPKGWPLIVEIARDEKLKLGQGKIQSGFDDPNDQQNEAPVESKPDDDQQTVAMRPEASPPTVVVDTDEADGFVKTVVVGGLPETEIITPKRGQLTTEPAKFREWAELGRT